MYQEFDELLVMDPLQRVSPIGYWDMNLEVPAALTVQDPVSI